MTYYKEEVFSHEKDIVEMNIQITKITSSYLDVINVYRSSNGNSLKLLNKIIDMISTDKPMLITGDFNICIQSHGNNRLC